MKTKIFALLICTMLFASCKKATIGPKGEDGKDGTNGVTTQEFKSVAVTSYTNGSYYMDLSVPGLSADETVIVVGQQSEAANPDNVDTVSWYSMPMSINGSNSSYLKYVVKNNYIRIIAVGNVYSTDRFNVKLSRIK